MDQPARQKDWGRGKIPYHAQKSNENMKEKIAKVGLIRTTRLNKQAAFLARGG